MCKRRDGSGYPLGLASNMIDPLSRIVVLTVVYDTLTSDRAYKKKELPHRAAENDTGATQGDVFVVSFVPLSHPVL